MELTETHPCGIVKKRFKLVQLLFDTFLIFQVSRYGVETMLTCFLQLADDGEFG
jgi:hypothetical protein